MTLALKFVELESRGQNPLSRAQASSLVDGINGVYSQCGLKLKLEEFEEVDAASYGLDRRLTSADQMDSVRKPFDSSHYLVVIHTPAWDHGAIGPANAWTAMPGQQPAGAVLEAPVASNLAITAHELGHYLGLNHAHDVSELMNPIIYRESTRLSPGECSRMRDTALASRAGAIREL